MFCYSSETGRKAAAYLLPYSVERETNLANPAVFILDRENIRMRSTSGRSRQGVENIEKVGQKKDTTSTDRKSK